MKKEELVKLILDGEITITQVIDEVIEINGIIGVGLISLGDGLKKYCHDKIKTGRIGEMINEGRKIAIALMVGNQIGNFNNNLEIAKDCLKNITHHRRAYLSDDDYRKFNETIDFLNAKRISEYDGNKFFAEAIAELENYENNSKQQN